MMGAGMNGMAGSPTPGNFMQQVSSSPDKSELYFSQIKDATFSLMNVTRWTQDV